VGALGCSIELVRKGGLELGNWEERAVISITRERLQMDSNKLEKVYDYSNVRILA